MEVLTIRLLFTCSLTVALREATGTAPQGVPNLGSYAAYLGLALYAPWHVFDNVAASYL